MGAACPVPRRPPPLWHPFDLQPEPSSAMAGGMGAGATSSRPGTMYSTSSSSKRTA